MVHKIGYGNRGDSISCYLPEGSVPDKSAVEELHRMTELEETLEKLGVYPGFFQGDKNQIEKIILTPDFHKGAGIPIGTVMMTKGFAVPQAMGNDINCGMRFYTTDLSEEQIRERLPELKKKIRHIFFEGGRQIPMTGRQRQALFRYGLEGILETHRDGRKDGLWRYYQPEVQEKWLDRTVFRGSLKADDTEGLEVLWRYSGLRRFTTDRLPMPGIITHTSHTKIRHTTRNYATLGIWKRFFQFSGSLLILCEFKIGLDLPAEHICFQDFFLRQGCIRAHEADPVLAVAMVPRILFREFLGYITCDAYISYRVLGKKAVGTSLQRDASCIAGGILRKRFFYRTLLPWATKNLGRFQRPKRS